MKTEIIEEKAWALLEYCPKTIITLNKNDVVVINENQYVVKYNILDLDKDLLQIIVIKNF